MRESNLSSLLAVTRAAGLGQQLELDLGIHYAPAIVREHGLQDTHLWPLVARRKGESFRVHARQAWDYPSLELRAANSWPAVTLDCDVPSAVVDCLYSNHQSFGNGPALPRPSVVVERRSNSHCHASWFLSRPVHRGESARPGPLRRLARITEFYRDALQADPGYAGVLTHNPLEETHGGSFQTHWGHRCGYSLDELAEVIPKGWRLPASPSTEQGRNCALFRSLLKWAGSPANIEREVLAVARATNDGLDVPLGDSEVAGLAKSVEGYRDGWIAKGRFYTEAERRAWASAMGLQSAVVRRAAKASRDQFIMAGRSQGMSLRQLARSFKLSINAIQNVIRRDG